MKFFQLAAEESLKSMNDLGDFFIAYFVCFELTEVCVFDILKKVCVYKEGWGLYGRGQVLFHLGTIQ